MAALRPMTVITHFPPTGDRSFEQRFNPCPCVRWRTEYEGSGLDNEAAGEKLTIEVEEMSMKRQLALPCAILATLLGSLVAANAQNSDTETAHAAAFVKDSVITTKIKAELAAEHVSSLGDIHVDTDKTGVVWLSGSVKTRKAADRAVAIARATAHVKRVHSDLRIAEGN